MIAMWVRFGWPVAWFLDGDRAAKSADVAYAGLGAGPGFVRGFANCCVVSPVVETACVYDGICPKFDA